jgi:hypothetical protein
MAISKVLKVSLGCAVGVLGVLFTVEAARDLIGALEDKARMGRVR